MQCILEQFSAERGTERSHESFFRPFSIYIRDLRIVYCFVLFSRCSSPFSQTEIAGRTEIILPYIDLVCKIAIFFFVLFVMCFGTYGKDTISVCKTQQKHVEKKNRLKYTDSGCNVPHALNLFLSVLFFVLKHSLNIFPSPSHPLMFSLFVVFFLVLLWIQFVFYFHVFCKEFSSATKNLLPKVNLGREEHLNDKMMN